MGRESGAVPWTKRRRRFTREDLALSLTQSLKGYGPDNYKVEPAERARFAVQIRRRKVPSPSLVASIPFRSTPERRRLLDIGWDRVAVGRTPYCRQVFAEAAGAVAAILEAYEIVYGAVGDDRGWNIVTPALRPRTPWPEPWTGEEEPIGAAHDQHYPASVARDGRGSVRRIRAKAATAGYGVAAGLVCTWAALQSFTASAGWTVEPIVGIVVLAGCVVLSTIVASSGLPDAMARRTAYMWGDSITTRALITFSFAAIPAIVWAILLIRLLGTPPA